MSSAPEYFFKKKLSAEELTKIKFFYDSLANVTIEQHPEWAKITNAKGNYQYFYATVNAKLKCFATIIHKNYSFFKIAYIFFGPIFSDTEVLIESIKRIREEYKKNGFYYIAVQLAIPVGNISEYIEYKLNSLFSIEYVYDRYNWTSVSIDLSDSIEDIFRNFSKGHKSAIKKSVSDGVYIKCAEAQHEVSALAELYRKMNFVRGRGDENAGELFKEIYEFLKQNGKGVVLNVYDSANVLVGGIIVIYQGNTVRYYRGASDPDRKELAVLHLAIFEAIKTAKEKGYKYFDLWGYNHFVDENDQVFYINRFKKGFSDNFLFYPKMMHISLRTGGFILYRMVRNNQHRINPILKLLRGK